MSTDTSAADLIDVHALRVGMFVLLDMGWMSHPFPLSHFKLSSADQIATIRSLGVDKVRWDPRQSDLPAPAGPPVEVAPAFASPAATAAGTRQAIETDGHENDDAGQPEPAQRLTQQRTALARCERQFSEAAAACKQATALVTSDPQQARVQVEALSNALLDKMLVEEELCIRLLRDAAGNRASAHALNVSIISLLLGRNFGLSDSEMADLGVGALLHDIGKIDVPDRLRHHDPQFTPSEAKAYEEHVVLGLARGQKMGLSAGAMQVIAQHHEFADNSGFPRKLGTERLSESARIVAMVNAYDNLCNPHLSARALTPHEALAHMFTQGKSRFDTAILGSFIKMMGVYPAGSTVQLTDERFAVVVSVNSSRPLKPRVLVHDAKVPRDEALVIDIGAQPGLGIRRSVKPLQLPTPALHYLAPRQRVAYYFESAQAARAAA
jgi:putative nucleotidyltransferase with HDIG domain